MHYSACPSDLDSPVSPQRWNAHAAGRGFDVSPGLRGSWGSQLSSSRVQRVSGDSGRRNSSVEAPSLGGFVGADLPRGSGLSERRRVAGGLGPRCCGQHRADGGQCVRIAPGRVSAVPPPPPRCTAARQRAGWSPAPAVASAPPHFTRLMDQRSSQILFSFGRDLRLI